jgi:NAD+ synthase (glutamine-hydrolysing)
VKIALGQLNPTIGDFASNVRLIDEALSRAEAAGAALLVTSELSVTGYPPRDLLERPAFIADAQRALQQLVARTRDTALVVGFPEPIVPGQSSSGRRIANSAVLLHQNRVVSVHRKSLLPTYDVFDEWRYFEPATDVACVELGGRRLGISICEDIWNDADFWPQRLYREDPIEKLVAKGAEILINISASPYTIEKRHLRPRMLATTARRWRRPLVFVNQVGGHDDLIFDGSSMVLDADGQLIARAAEHTPDFLVVDLDARQHQDQGTIRPFDDSDARSALEALVLGTRDYARRCGFKRAVLGVSGGIDSALVAAIAARALGPENVLGVAMPSRYSSDGSRSDAAALAKNLGIQYQEIPIESVFSAYLQTLAPAFAGRAPDVIASSGGELRSPELIAGGLGDPLGVPDTTEENLQARVRGGLLMALSNKFGSLLLTTGNKSELATGYCTLYGDMCGGLAVISDVPKTMVYQLARAVNEGGEIIPRATIEKPPSAELRPDQTDQDTLPPYDVLDPVLEAHLEDGLDRQALVAKGFDPKLVDDVIRMVRLSEYKRRQAAPGLKVTGKAFGPGRRYPIAHAFRG